jgi:hypothetical protein
LVRDSGSTRRYSLSYEPSYVDIVIEPQTRVPDFYVGRALPSIDSQVNATALLNNGSLLDPSDLTYRWRLNNLVLEGGPIRGTNQVSFKTPRGGDHVLRVEIADSRGTLLGEQIVAMPSERPELVFYESNPLFGQSHIAITDQLVLTGQAATLVAEPYNMDILVYNNPEVVEWSIDNNETASNSASPYQITIQRAGEGNRSEISLGIYSTRELLQSTTGSITVTF